LRANYTQQKKHR